MRSLLSVLLCPLLLSLLRPSSACLLCPLHIPARPKPLDQFRLPSIQKIVHTADTFEWLCQNGSKLATVSAQCRADVSHLFCSLTRLVQSLKTECPGADEGMAQCAECRRKTDILYRENKWVLTWIDSLGKMPSGISDGNYHWLGDYEQCLRLRDDGLFNGQYCLLEFRVPDGVLLNSEHCEDGSEPLEVVLGICLPANCDQHETRGLVEYVAEHHPIQVRCSSSPRAMPWPSVLLLAVCLLWLSLVLAVSLLHWLRPSLSLPPPFTALLLQTHLRHSLRTIRPPDAPFQAVQGMQCISAAMLVFGYAQVWVMPFLENIGHHYTFMDSTLSQPMVNYSVYADGLFALGTFQLTYQYAIGGTATPREPRLCQLMRVLKRRFLRLLPLYFLCTLTMAFLFTFLGEGPMWSRIDIAQRCARNWPTNLLLVNNLFGFSHIFLLLSLAALWFFPRHQTRLLWALSAFFMCSILFCLAVSLLFGTPPTLIPHLMNQSSFQPFADLLFLNPVARAGPFLVALFVSLWLLPRLAHQKHLLRALCPLGSLLLILLLALLLWCPHWLWSVPPYASSSHSSVPLPFFPALYAAFHRTAWATLLLLLAILLDASRGNALNSFFCWRCFHPLSKLVFPVLLLSEPIALSLFSSLHRPVHSTPLSTVLAWIGILVCSLIVALLIDTTLTRPIRWICGGREETNDAVNSSSNNRMTNGRMIMEMEGEGKKRTMG
ncbi:hypothetical protein niasHT_030720 [Heterodera trifolii]|uniref:Nose resistant-to-fluoxetine protein N-terminal domain-containing protein n=1 Tax=Heterodera trifolii TaxID=157864 RepID=A0ABD2HN72_9BILA